MKNRALLISEVGKGISKAVLMALFAGAVMVAPGGVAGTMEILDKLIRDRTGRNYRQEQIERSLRYLRSKKLLDIQRRYSQEVFSLTKQGFLRARKLSRSFDIPAQKKCDQRWRIVIFDIPERKRKERDVFRKRLKTWGFANVQKSIWFYPYDCREQVYYLAGQMFIKPYVRYIETEKFTGDRDLRERFGL